LQQQQGSRSLTGHRHLEAGRSASLKQEDHYCKKEEERQPRKQPLSTIVAEGERQVAPIPHSQSVAGHQDPRETVFSRKSTAPQREMPRN
jgi:hypothetical protein